MKAINIKMSIINKIASLEKVNSNSLDFLESLSIVQLSTLLSVYEKKFQSEMEQITIEIF